MRRLLGFVILIVCLAATPALAQQVTIDYAHDFDFKSVKTFEFMDTPETNVKDQLMDGRIKDAIITALKDGGLTQVESEPDIYVTYHMTAQQNAVLTTTGFGYGGFGPGWGAWGAGVGTATTTESTYTEGTLIVDAYGPADKKMVWRGTGTVVVKAKPQKQTQQIQNIIAKMGVKWQKILKNMGE